MSTLSLLPPSIKDERFKILAQLSDRLRSLEIDERLAVYVIDQVDVSVLPYLGEQFNVMGIRGWLLAETEQQQRDLIKNAIALHKTAGTPYAVRLALATVGYPNAVIEENPILKFDGSWAFDGSEVFDSDKVFGFIVTLDSVRAPVSAEALRLVLAMINEWKNARSELLDLRIGNISLFSNLLFFDGSWAFDGAQSFDGVKNI